MRDEKPQEMRQPNVFSKVSSQEDMRLARIKSTASGFAQSGFVKKELYAGFEIPAKETAMILRKAPFKKTAFRKQSEFFPRNTVSTKQTIWYWNQCTKQAFSGTFSKVRDTEACVSEIRERNQDPCSFKAGCIPQMLPKPQVDKQESRQPLKIQGLGGFSCFLWACFPLCFPFTDSKRPL